MYKETPSKNANFLIHQSIPEDLPPASSQGGAGEPTKQNHQNPTPTKNSNTITPHLLSQINLKVE